MVGQQLLSNFMNLPRGNDNSFSVDRPADNDVIGSPNENGIRKRKRERFADFLQETLCWRKVPVTPYHLNMEMVGRDGNSSKITELWGRCGQPFGERETAATKVIKKRKSSSSPKPYDAEWINSFQGLTFKLDSCCSMKCSCKKPCGQVSPRSKFNYSVAISGSPRRFLRESRLKLHNSEKDRQQIIRAAKLKLLKLKRKREGSVKLEETRKKQPNISYEKLPIFGTSNSSKFQDFSNLSGEIDKAFIDSGGSFNTGNNQIFKNFSSNADPANMLSEEKCQTVVDNASQDSKSMLSVKSEHLPDKSCSVEARVNCDECSVNELASYFEDFVHIPKNMSSMAEMMYA